MEKRVLGYQLPERLTFMEFFKRKSFAGDD